MGRANRFLAPRAARLALSFEAVKFAERVAAGRRSLTGNPVRAENYANSEAPYAAPRAGEGINLFVMGGSLGASVFATIVPEAIGLLPPELRGRLRIAQQARANDLEIARKAYDGLGMQVELQPFFSDVPDRLARAHLLICRSGASTVAELTAAGRPGILVPLPKSIDDHQMANARALEAAGGGWVMPQSELSPRRLADKLQALLGDPVSLERAAAAARQMGRRDAAERLADLVVNALSADAQQELREGRH
jgi:UDP-N-acetylglucosamine--N-acetylmuramyl-(pentapeptide) pyrophosphoryl-undecaprenol N-acetylglucosamine transferase